jgi:hypothetical protein
MRSNLSSSISIKSWFHPCLLSYSTALGIFVATHRAFCGAQMMSDGTALQCKCNQSWVPGRQRKQALQYYTYRHRLSPRGPCLLRTRKRFRQAQGPSQSISLAGRRTSRWSSGRRRGSAHQTSDPCLSLYTAPPAAARLWTWARRAAATVSPNRRCPALPTLRLPRACPVPAAGSMVCRMTPAGRARSNAGDHAIARGRYPRSSSSRSRPAHQRAGQTGRRCQRRARAPAAPLQLLQRGPPPLKIRTPKISLHPRRHPHPQQELQQVALMSRLQPMASALRNRTVARFELTRACPHVCLGN